MTGPRKLFCDGIVKGLNQTEAYRAAYPKSSHEAAMRSASDLLRIPEIADEIARQRALAESKAGSAVMTLAEKRTKLAGIARAATGEYDSCRVSLSDKLAAIKLDNDLAGDGSEAGANDALSALIGSLRR